MKHSVTTGGPDMGHGVSPETIQKWRKRGTDDVQDHSSHP